MTDVMETVLNGVEGEESMTIADETSGGGDKSLMIAEDQDETKEGENDTGDIASGLAGGDLEDTTDSISGANLIITTDDEKDQGEDGQDQGMNGEEDEAKLLEMDGDETNENGDDSNMDISDDVSMAKVDSMYTGGGDDQNSNASIEESSLIIAAASPDDKKFSRLDTILQNGVEANTNENSSSSSTGDNNKPLLSGLLERKDTGSSLLKKPGQQSRSFSVSDGNAIAKELEEQVVKLNELLVLKEKEWSAILRLKKHMEYALDQVKCTQRIAKVQDGMNGPMSTTDIKACMSLIMSEKDMFSLAERQIEESIESTETENESLQTIFPFRSASTTITSVQSALVIDEGAGQKEDILSASAALQKLCERKRQAMDDLLPGRASRPRIVDVQSNSNASAPGQRKQYGRKGNMVNVQSIIETHRNLTGDRPKGGPKPRPKPVLKMSPDRLYHKTLEELLAVAQADKLLKDTTTGNLSGPPAPAVPQIASTRSLATSKPKNGKPTGRQSATSSSNSLLISNPTPSGSGTLAKMLSPSTHSSGMGSTRTINDGSTNSSQKFSNKLPTSDANLSLANLLATSKVESKVNLAKIKKERVREEEASHVPSQQQADAVPICQGCNLSRAQFVCAGCANQWYCSRECQVAAWDEHSEICSG